MGTDGTGARVAILFKNELHPVHAGFADAIGADRVQLPVTDHDLLTGSVVEDVLGVARRIPSMSTEYDVYLSEDVAGLYAASYLTARTDGLNIHLAADHRTFGLDGYDIGPWSPHSVAKWIDRTVDITIIHRLLRHNVDGAIAVSGLVAQNVSRIAPDVPVRVVHPYVKPDLFDRLGEMEPSLDGKDAVFVGKNRTHKGVDLLCRAWPRIRAEHPDATLELVGSEHVERNVPGVTVTGYVDDIGEAYRDASLYVHPARFEAFGVAVLEAMRAGVPAIGTTNCGVTPHLSAVDSSLRCEPSPDAIAESVAEYFDRDLDERRSISEVARETTTKFDCQRSKRTFEEQFTRLLAEIDGL